VPAVVEITPPFFEVGPKAYAYGRELVRLAVCADRLSAEYGVQIILTLNTRTSPRSPGR